MFARMRSVWLSLRHRAQFESELDDEMRFHVEARADDLIRSGLSRSEAVRRARVEFGCVEAHQDGVRESRHVNWFEDLAQDLRFGARMLRKSPGFTAVAILTLALGIGANTAIFSLINAVALRSLPVANPEQLVLLEWTAHRQPHATSFSRYGGCPADAPGSSSSSVTGCSVSYPMFEQIRSARDIFSGVFCFTRMVTWLKVDDHPGEIWGMNVSGDFFSTLGARAATGRLIEPSDDIPGAMPVIVMSYRYWQAELGADSTVVGKTALINGQPVRIVGITDRSFPEVDPGTVVDFWLPLTSQHALFPQAQSRTDPRSLSFEVMGRLKAGVTTKRAEAEVNAMFVQGTTSSPTAIFKPDDEPRAMLVSAAAGLASLRTLYANPLVVLMTVVSLILLLACANVAGLMLVRSSAREKEMAVRRALGAGRWRVTRQLLTESVLLSVAGGGLGIAFAEVATKSLVAFLSASSFFPLQIDVGIDGHVLWFTLGVSTIVGILFGLAPALRGSRVDVAPTLKLSVGNTRNSRGQSSRLSHMLVVAQVAISTLVLVGAGLLGLTLFHLETTDAGFNTENLLLFEVNMRASGITGFDNPRFDELNRELRDRFAAMPGVSSATYSMIPLLAGGSFDGDFSIAGAVSVSEATVDELGVGPDFFETMRIPLLAGRTLKRADFEPTARPIPVVVTQMFAHRIFGNSDPLGRSLSEKGPQPTQFQVVGVVGDTKYESVRNDTQPTIFMPDKRSSPTFELRTHGDPKALISMVRSAVSQVNPDFLVLRMMTQSEQIDRTIYQERLIATLSILFGILALSLACVGLYGLVAYGVVRRTHEIGVRMALGAQRYQIMRLTVMQGLVLTLVGIAVGIGAAAGVTRYLASLLYGVRPVDPWTFGGIAILLGGIAACACYIPARRAMRVDPMVALRHE